MNKELLMGYLEHMRDVQGERADNAHSDFQQGLLLGSHMVLDILLNRIRAGEFDKGE
jgi:hypothetical protein